MTPSAPPNLCVPPVLHSLHYLDVAVSEPSPGVPQFMSLGFMDGIPFTRYDSERGQVELLMQWMEDGAEPGYWESQTQIAVRNQHLDARNLETLQHRYNQSGGLHTSQWLYGCDLLDNGSVRGSSRYRYDGWDFISFKLRYKSFVTANNAAEITQRLWKEKGNVAGDMGRKNTAPIPFPWNSIKEEHGTLILSCHVYGFYPNTTAVSWMKGSEIRDQKMEWGGIVPNSDGTFHTWARIEALPEEWEQYRCQVEHPGMLEPGIFTWEPTYGGNLAMVIAVSIIAAILVLVLIGFGVWRFQSGNTRDGAGMGAAGMGMGTPGTGVGNPGTGVGTAGPGWGTKNGNKDTRRG
uniref:Ig-like domain-containing protein n=1 Tax=Cyanistes caeruleus TaxID=156563 RepID=A0A8C0UHK9_CYACU